MAANKLIFHGGRITGLEINEACPPFTKEEMEALPNIQAAHYYNACDCLRYPNISPKDRTRFKGQRTRLEKECRKTLEQLNAAKGENAG